jgi:pyruvate formate lyase activating enzyme
MLAVDKGLCVGCGLCASVCPAGAITLEYGQATINPELCTLCYRCTEVCPRGAIREEVKVRGVAEVKKSLEELRRRMETLKNRLKIFER